MAKTNLTGMDVEALLALRGQIDSALDERRNKLQDQLAALGMDSSISRVMRPGRGKGGGSAMKGVKVAPKYRGPEGETWAGRGATPRWLVALTKKGSGKKIEDFLIDKKTKVAA